MDVRVSPNAPADAALAMYVYPRLTTTTDFETTLAGQMRGSYIWQSGQVPVSTLPAGPGGGSEVVLPIDSAAPPPPGGLSSIGLNSTNNGVYPVQIGVVNRSNGAFLGDPLTTYLVWVPTANGFPKLAVSWVLPVRAAPALTNSGEPGRLSASTVTGLGGEIGVLDAHPGVAVSVIPDPQTLDSLSAAGASGKAPLAALSAVAAGPDQVLPAPYVALDLPALEAAGLDGEVRAQLRAGAGTLQTTLQTSADPGTWAVDGPLDPSTAGVLEARGAVRLVVPDGDLDPLPAGQQTTFAQPTSLETPGVNQASPGTTSVLGADTNLDRHFTNTGDQVLQADQLLAELSMIETETPGDQRGIGVLTPRSWTANTAFIETVLDGLHGNPLLQPMTLDQLFASVPRATTPLSRSLVSPRPPTDTFSEAAAVRAVRRQLSAFESTFPTATAQAGAFARRVLVGESSDLSARRRSTALGSVAHDLSAATGRVRLPPGVSLTLTSQNGNVPVTVLSTSSGVARVRLQLTSQKLTFHSFKPPEGTCQSSDATTVVCSLSLTGPATTLRVPVVARTTGVFTLQLALRSGDGSLVLGQAHYTVRSTAVSVVAIILMIGAVLLLGVWWVRDRRHGRRARQLVDPPLPPVDEGGDGSGDASVASPGAEVALSGRGAGNGAALPVEGTRSLPGAVRATAPGKREAASGRLADGESANGAPAAPEPGEGVPERADSAPQPDDGVAQPDDGVAQPDDGVVQPEPEPAAGTAGRPEEAIALWVDDDPVVAEFFASPPPEYPDRPPRAGHRR
jgi:hypothetical protein